jgi:hypothetical protein
MRRFFDKRATVVDVTNKEVIDLFQDGLYHRRTFEDFGRRRPSSITHLKDMITSWADEEDKANAKYEAICGKSKQNTGGSTTTTRITSRDVVFNDVALSSLKTPEWSQLVFCDVFVTILVWSLWWRHICSSVMKLVFSS